VSSEGIGLIVAAVILLVSFGSVLAMGLPILSAILGVGVATGLIALLANLVDVPDWATSVATMIAIGVGIDYSLLIVTRYRAALQRGLDPEAAVGEAVGTAGRAVVFAGATVMVSLLGMIVMNLPYLYGVAIGSALAVGVMVALSVTLLPAVLGFVGHTSTVSACRSPRPTGPDVHWPSGGAGRSSTGRGGRRSPDSCCSSCWPRRRCRCGSGSPTPATAPSR
jgi:RND superfamily putative drug exporter